MQKLNRRTSLGEKAITLIALVVTIVILLILAGVTITMTLGQNGLFTRAREGAAAYNESEVRDDLSMLITQYTWDKASEKTDKSLGDYLKENGATRVKENTDGKTLEVEYKNYVFTVDKDSGEITGAREKGNEPITPKVGDVVKYIPDKVENYSLSAANSGYSSDQTIDSTYDPTVWKVMEIDESGKITKLFGTPKGVKVGVCLAGATGYNNGVYLLNDICKSRYGNTSLGAIARSLKIEDIESKLNEAGKTAKNTFKDTYEQQYGKTKKYTGNIAQYPAIYAQEKYSGVNVSDVADNTQVITGDIDETAQAKLNLNGKTQSDAIYTSLPTPAASKGTSVENLTCTQTGYSLKTPSSYFDDENFYNMIFGTGRILWIATRNVSCDLYPYHARFDFCLYRIYRDNLYGCSIFYSTGYEGWSDHLLAPVVTFDSAIQVKSGSGTTDDPFVIGK